MKLNLLKQALLEVCIDNEYLQKYLELINTNEATKKIKCVTQKHHAIPVSYYKAKFKCASRLAAEKFASQDCNNFLVNLTYVDHIIAHCYLALAAKDEKFKFANTNMITLVSKLSPENFIALKNVAAYQQAYTELRRLKSKLQLGELSHNFGRRYTMSEETKLKISLALTGKKRTAEQRQRLSESKLGKNTGIKNPWYGKHHTEETLQKLRGRVISEETRLKLRNKGLGRQATELTKTKQSQALLGHPYWGCPKQTSKTKEKISLALRGRKSTLGTAHFSALGKRNAGRIWICKDMNSKMIFKEELDTYLLLGWQRGRGNWTPSRGKLLE